jgi:mRNA interferase MazF
MPTFSQGDIVRVPFPYTDRGTRQHRPALVISNGAVDGDGRLLWVAMITAAANRPWTGDCPIADYGAAGLPIPSVVRAAKISTIQARDAQIIGTIDEKTKSRVLETIQSILRA